MTRGEKLFWGIFALIIIAGVALLVTYRVSHPPVEAPAKVVSDPTTLPGMREIALPWDNGQAQLKERLAALGFQVNAMEGTIIHIHQHVNIYINGTEVTVPAGIGIGENNAFFSPIHVHDTSGIIHVESPTAQEYTLGQFFDVWGTRFTSACIGSYCADENNTLSVYANGELYQGDPRQLVLTSHEEIAIIFGTSGQLPASIPKSYTFPSGY
jgi:hypothetical protein